MKKMAMHPMLVVQGAAADTDLLVMLVETQDKFAVEYLQGC